MAKRSTLDLRSLFTDANVERVSAAPIADTLGSLRAALRTKSLSPTLVAYAEATHDIAQLRGPWQLRGFGSALDEVTTCGALFARFGDSPFPAVRLGSDRRGIDFWVDATSGRVITLHHDASLSEEAAKCRGSTVATFVAQLVERGAAFEVLQLARLQLALHAVSAKTELARQHAWARAAADVLGISLTELARLIGYLPYELLHLEQAVVEELALELAPTKAKKPAKGKRVTLPRPLAKALEEGARTLDLAGLLDNTLPAAITELSTLEELDLSANPRLDFDAAFEMLAQLPRLRVVTFTDCRMEELPASLGNITSLEQLDLSGSVLKGPHNFFSLEQAAPILRRLPKLRVLDAPVSRPPADLAAFIAALPSIENLNIDSLQGGFLDVPLRCDGSPTLEVLSARSLALDPLLDVDPARFPRLRRLVLAQASLRVYPGDSDDEDQHLARRNARFEELFAWLARLPSLREVDLRVKGLWTPGIPPGIAKLAVEELWLEANELPAWIGTMTALRRLHVYYLREALPKTIGHLVNLEVLDLLGNGGSDAPSRIATLPDEIGSLSKLRELSTGKLERWPDSLRRCTALERLSSPDAGPPFLRELASLTSSSGAIDELVHLPKLETIDLSGAKRIPRELAAHPSLHTVRWWAYACEDNVDDILERIATIPNLHTLELAYLGRATLPASLARASLRALSLSRIMREATKLDLDAVFTLFSSAPLESLKLSIDDLSALPESLGSLASLRRLDIRGSRITSLPASLADLPRLERIDLRQTKTGASERKRLRALGCRVQVWDW